MGLDVVRALREGRVRIVRDEIVTVGTGFTLVAKNNSRRAQITVTNGQSSSGRLSFDKSVSSTRGYPMVAATGFFQLVADEDGEAAFKELFGIMDVAGDWHVVEWEAYE